MKFYDRENEIGELHTIREQSISDHSRFTVITGRRRIGKTSLILKALEGKNPVYLFAGKKSETLLCREFGAEISEKLGVFVPEEIRSFSSLFRKTPFKTRSAGASAGI
jgi:AAA+ ATPase superfamily predicted ATPase